MIIKTMTVKDRLITYLKHSGLSRSRFERTCGLANGFVNSIGISIRTDSLDKISNAFPDLSRSWLLTGEGFMLKEGGPSYEIVEKRLGSADSASTTASEREIEYKVENDFLREELERERKLNRELIELNAILKYKAEHKNSTSSNGA